MATESSSAISTMPKDHTGCKQTSSLSFTLFIPFVDGETETNYIFDGKYCPQVCRKRVLVTTMVQ